MTFNVLTAEFLHETNTFSVRKTGIPAFEAGRFCVGNDGLIGLEGTNTGVAGCLWLAHDARGVSHCWTFRPCDT